MTDPLPLTEKTALSPTQIVSLRGLERIFGKVFTVSNAATEVSEGAHVPDTRQRYRFPLRPDEAPLMASVDVLAPEYGPPFITLEKSAPVFTCHLYTSPEPLAVTEKLVSAPAQIVIATGCIVICGGVDTVSSAALVGTFPQRLENIAL